MHPPSPGGSARVVMTSPSVKSTQPVRGGAIIRKIQTTCSPVMVSLCVDDVLIIIKG